MSAITSLHLCYEPPTYSASLLTPAIEWLRAHARIIWRTATALGIAAYAARIVQAHCIGCDAIALLPYWGAVAGMAILWRADVRIGWCQEPESEASR